MASAHEVTVDWLEAARAGDLDTVWALTEPNMRRWWILTWLEANHWRGAPEAALHFADQAAEAGIDALPFADLFRSSVGPNLAETYPIELGMLGDRRPMGRDLEAVLLVPTDKPITEGLVLAQVLLWRLTDDGWRLAAWDDRLPVASWPPTTELVP